MHLLLEYILKPKKFNMRKEGIFLGFFIISVVLTSVWTKENKMLATGEEGTPFANLEYVARTSKENWQNVSL